ncbi:MAG: prolipoprotein diacylglyceryl transferase [Planctomycetes bacterium]|nr:prolipoprotein diacylglyceryl transferase [Planctomycetota bacterium]
MTAWDLATSLPAIQSLLEIPYHGFDPVLVDFPGPLDLRWYGLMYVVGFVAGAWILERLNKRGFLGLPPEGPQDLMLWLIGGVVLGGRLGFILFYKPETFRDPLSIFAVWEGGMSFHGGLLGVIFATLLFCKRRRVAPLRIMDGLALAVTPGIFAVRVANFINGELYGRVTDASVPWAMRFPTDPVAWTGLRLDGLATRARELRILEAFENGDWDKIAHAVPLRHPSQAYEALCEGLLLGVILFVLWRRTRTAPLGFGRYAGTFVVGYGVLRWILEFFRQPDAQFAEKPGDLGTVLGFMSMGQVLCTLMILGGLWLLFRRTKNGDPRLEDPSGTTS